MRETRWSKLSVVTPNRYVSRDPPYSDTMPEKLRIDTKKAYRDASIPRGHSLAANTRQGMRAICPKTLKNKSSPAAKKALGSPNVWLKWVTKMMGEAPAMVEITTM
jgi:hypothetical protein